MLEYTKLFNDDVNYHVIEPDFSLLFTLDTDKRCTPHSRHEDAAHTQTRRHTDAQKEERRAV